MPSLPLTNWLNAAKEAARRGGDALEQWRFKFKVREKAGPTSSPRPTTPPSTPSANTSRGVFPTTLFVGEEGDDLKSRPAADAHHAGLSIHSTAPRTTSTTCRCIAFPSV